MKIPSARKLFQSYVVLLVAVAAGAVLVSIAGDVGRAGSIPLWRQEKTVDFGVSLAFEGPSARAILAAQEASGEAYFYGPLAAGECLPAIDVTEVAPRFALHGAGTVYRFGRRQDGDVEMTVQFTQFPALIPEGMPILQVCFPWGLDHEQALWLEPSQGRAEANPFIGDPPIAPPPLRRLPGESSAYLGRDAAGYAVVAGRSTFSAVERRCELRVEDPASVVIEFGEIEDGWKFVRRDSLQVAAGARGRDAVRVRWPFFRILIAGEGGRAHLSLSSVPGG